MIAPSDQYSFIIALWDQTKLPILIIYSLYISVKKYLYKKYNFTIAASCKLNLTYKVNEASNDIQAEVVVVVA